ncbi:MAG: DUF1501 domain-containing protein [Pseudomonadota bacterium]|nr:DUF1501 domain-containing protein [Pseudomonadota bacterium]
MVAINRRAILKGSAALAGAIATPRALSAAATEAPRLLLIIMRGGVDGLSLLPPLGDPDYRRLRPNTAVEDAVALDGTFGLHPGLKLLRRLWDRGEMAAVHAICTPYRDRSHFDAQNVLESGLPGPSGTATGWLNRAIALRPDPARLAMAIGTSPSLALRGPVTVQSWAPSVLPDAGADLLGRLAPLWAADPLLGPQLRQAMETRGLTAGMGDMGAGANGAGRIRPLLDGAARLLADPGGPQIAVVDSTGWDSHANAPGLLGRLTADLDNGLEALIAGLGPVWSRTIVVMVSEFGRAAAENGNRGADHGTGGMAILFGGAVAGGRIAGQWPGLGTRDLLDGRDLRPTSDIRGLFASLAHDHLRFPARAIGETILPGISPDPAFTDLIRA